MDGFCPIRSRPMHGDLTRPTYVVGLLLLAWTLVLLQLMPEYWPMTAVPMHDADDALRLRPGCGAGGGVTVEAADAPPRRGGWRLFLGGGGWFHRQEARLAPPVG